MWLRAISWILARNKCNNSVRGAQEPIQTLSKTYPPFQNPSKTYRTPVGNLYTTYVWTILLLWCGTWIWAFRMTKLTFFFLVNKYVFAFCCYFLLLVAIRCCYLCVLVAISCYVLLLVVAAQIIRTRASHTFKNRTLKPKRTGMAQHQKYMGVGHNNKYSFYFQCAYLFS